eukprot:scaffold637_cov118-Isochrysis_galbana.AAC.20
MPSPPRGPVPTLPSPDTPNPDDGAILRPHPASAAEAGAAAAGAAAGGASCSRCSCKSCRACMKPEKRRDRSLNVAESASPSARIDVWSEGGDSV